MDLDTSYRDYEYLQFGVDSFLNSSYFSHSYFSVLDLLRNIRTQVLIKLIKPYTRIHIPFISNELNIDATDVEALLVQCILDK